MSDLNAMAESLRALEKDALQLFDQLKDGGADTDLIEQAKAKQGEAISLAQKALSPSWFSAEGTQLSD